MKSALLVSLSKRDRRTLFAGALVVVAIAAGGKGLPALARWQESARSASNVLVARALRAEASAQNRPAVRTALASVRTRLESSGSMLLPAESVVAATASLVDAIGEATDASGAELASMQPTIDTTRGAVLLHPTARVTVIGSAEHVVDFLAAIEEGPALLEIRELSLTIMDQGSVLSQNRSIRAELLIGGLARVQAAPLAERVAP
jgi:Type II secretion system (T2SS), protein M subtype b